MSAPLPASIPNGSATEKASRTLSVPDLPLDEKSTKFDLPSGFIPNGDLSKFHAITGQKDEYWRKAVTEDSEHAWYKSGGRCIRGKGRPIRSSPIGRKTPSTRG